MFLAFHRGSGGNRFALAGGWGRRPTRRKMMQWQRADKYRKWEPTIHTHTHRQGCACIRVCVVCGLFLHAYRDNGESISYLLVNGGIANSDKKRVYQLKVLFLWKHTHRVWAGKWNVKCLVAPPGVQSSSPPLDYAAGGRTCWHSCAKSVNTRYELTNWRDNRQRAQW